MSKLIIVGDIHGDVYKLRKLISKIPKNKQIVFLGDYINLGRHSKEVIEELIDISNSFDCIFLAGNHDLSLLNYLDGKIEFIEFATLGGIPTILSYIDKAKGDVRGQLSKLIPERHKIFLRKLAPYFENDEYIISHSGINCAKPFSRKISDLIYNKKFEEQIELSLGKTIVCGHFIQTNLKPFVTNNFICIDTGCGTLKNGVLTAINLSERSFISIT